MWRKRRLSGPSWEKSRSLALYTGTPWMLLIPWRLIKYPKWYSDKKILQCSVVTFWRLVFSHKSNLMNSTDKGFPGQLERWKCWQPGEQIKSAECAVFAASQVSHQPIKKGWGQPFLNTPREKKKSLHHGKNSNWWVLASILWDAKNDTFPPTPGRCWCFKVSKEILSIGVFGSDGLCGGSKLD